MEDQKQPGIVSKFFKLVGTLILFLLPSIKILSLNKNLSRSKSITEDKWFSKQIILNYILAILLFFPIIGGYYKINKIYDRDINFHSRLAKAQSVDSFIDRMSSYKSTISINKNESREVRIQKKRTQIRLLAIVIVALITLLVQVSLSVVIIYFHPIVMDSKKLKKLLISNGVIRKEDEKVSIVFATPIGFLITITGSSAKEIAYMDRIWAGLNIRIKDWVEDPDERSVVFFRKAFELQDVYIYDKI